MSDLASIERALEQAGIRVTRSDYETKGIRKPRLVVAAKSPFGYEGGKIDFYFDAGNRLVGIDGWNEHEVPGNE